MALRPAAIQGSASPDVLMRSLLSGHTMGREEGRAQLCLHLLQRMALISLLQSESTIAGKTPRAT